MYSLILILIVTVSAFAYNSEMWDGMHGYFSAGQNESSLFLPILIAGIITFILITTLYHFIHIKMMKHYHEKMLHEHRKLLDEMMEKHSKKKE